MNAPNAGLAVTILGSGTCVPSLRRSACSVLVSGAGERLLLDIGPGTMRRLTESGRSIMDVTRILLSHFHPDHSGELAPFLFASKYPYATRRQSPLTIVGGCGLGAFLEKLSSVYGHWIDLGGTPLTVVESGRPASNRLQFSEFTVKTCPVVHNPESVAFRIQDHRGGSVVYTGDTDECENLVSFSRGADLLICESAFPDEGKAPGHLTPSLAGDLARRAKVKKLVLTHFYPECDRIDIERQCRSTWPGPLVLAEDLMEIPL